jgi:hypothetical protein
MIALVGQAILPAAAFQAALWVGQAVSLASPACGRGPAEPRASASGRTLGHTYSPSVSAGAEPGAHS